MVREMAVTKAHHDQQLDFITNMMSNEAWNKIEELRAQHWREEFWGEKKVMYVCLSKRFDDAEGDVATVDGRETLAEDDSVTMEEPH